MHLLAQAATTTENVDSVFLFIFALCAAFLVFITFLLIYFTFRYSRKRNPRGTDIEGNHLLETVWTLMPLVLFMVMFYYGWTNYEYLRSAPRDAMAVKVTGRQWAWEFEYPNGKRAEELYLVVNRPVKFLVRSADVIHGFYIPAFRIKTDALPTQELMTWCTPTQLGIYDIECTVICGPSHSYMLSHAIVVPEDEFKAWYFGPEDAPRPGLAYSGGAGASGAGGGAGVGSVDPPGLGVLKSKLCITCHTIDGKPNVGPSLKGIYGQVSRVIVEGKERDLVVDDEFLRRAILNPASQRVKGYPHIMQPLPISDAELELVVGYIKELK